MKRKQILNIMAWVWGMLLCPLGIALYTKANFGLSMVAAPAYIIHTKIKTIFEWYSQGISEYIFQTILLIILCVAIQRFKKSYLLTFVVAIISGSMIDFWFLILGGNQVYGSMGLRIIAFILGELALTIAIALFFRTTLPVQVYELAVTEISDKWKIDKNKVKMCHDIIMLMLSIILAITLNHSFAGLGIGTIIITFINAPLIKLFGEIIDRCFFRRMK